MLTIKKFKEIIEADPVWKYKCYKHCKSTDLAREYKMWCELWDEILKEFPGFNSEINVYQDGSKSLVFTYYKGRGKTFHEGKGKRMIDALDEAILLPALESLTAKYYTVNLIKQAA